MKVELKRLGCLLGVTLLSIQSAAIAAQKPQFLQGLSTSSPLLAQRQSRIAEADRLLQQDIQQFEAKQFQAALSAWQSALNIYRDLDVQLQPLSGAQREAQSISNLFQMPALIGATATEAAVKPLLANASLIHLATHGLLEYGDPRETSSRNTPGAVALTPGNGEDGLLNNNANPS